MRIFSLFLLFMTISSSALAFTCEVGPKKKKIQISESGNYLVRDGGYAYILKYDQDDQYLCLMIEGGPSDLNVTHESYGPRKSHLSLGKKGESSNIEIVCN